ncbi:MAG: DUF1761 domain-containing protein [Parerythrobacter sp.]
MIYIVENAWPILLAATLAFALGFVWPSPRGRGRSRLRISLGAQALVFASLVWMAAILAGALILAPVDAAGWTVALGTAAIIWGGFVLPVVAADAARSRAGWRRPVVLASYWLTAMLLMAATLKLVGVEGPEVEPKAALAYADNDQPGLAHPLLPGAYRLGSVDGEPADLGHAITVEVDEDTIAMFSQCVTPRWRYRHEAGALVTHTIPEPICSRAFYPAEEALIAVFNAPRTILHTPENGIHLANDDHAVTLFSQ